MVLAISAIVFTITGLRSTGWSVGEFMAPLAMPKYLFSVLSLSVLCSIAANLLVNYAVSHMSVFKVSSFGALSTLCTMVAGIVFLKEPVSWELLLGAVLILVGIRQITKPVPQKEEKVSK
jgi:drug/metabolite transporter (DMT)-like permease